ncbi:MAG: PEP-CTERM sorting domain-containing protein [Pirellulaceae bacterium]
MLIARHNWIGRSAAHDYRLGADNVVGGGNDLTLFTKDYTANALNWSVNTSIGEGPIVALGNNIRFAYETVSAGSGDMTDGNFIDAVKFGSVSVPEPSTAAVLGLATLGLVFRRRRGTA